MNNDNDSRIKNIEEKLDILLNRDIVEKKDLEKLGNDLNSKLNSFNDRLTSMETRMSFYDYSTQHAARQNAVPQPLGRTPRGNAVNEPRGQWRSENPYRR